ncbi:hypothetical protein GCM10009868_26900 [Terrabacter aerolatus]|uniref:LysM domain-containing protein n=1 Tax=Terrabacter aerolatus TaxID=422442 RepID=A0A512CWV5_9MICO|nr:LysM domain-containing protein [Terrabacter aerolatus]GEO28677.1 hypothetical protein TAE01_04870 [Terrabacter aerolatus]
MLFATVVRHGPPPAARVRPDEVLLVVLGWVGLGLAAWLALGSLLGVAALLPGATGRAAAVLAQRITPVAVRKALALVLGASVGSLALPPALVSVAGSGPVTRGAGPAGLATDDPAPRDAGPRDPAPRAAVRGESPARDLVPGFTPSDVTPGFVPSLTPERAETTPAPAPATSRPAGPGYVPSPPPTVHDADRPRLLAPAPRPTAAAHELVTVHRGDSLWSVAARHLGPGASDSEVAREWPRWYAANRDVVGDDPDLLVPGQQLRPPSPASPGRSRLDHHPSAPAAGPDTGLDTGAPAPQGDQ